MVSTRSQGRPTNKRPAESAGTGSKAKVAKSAEQPTDVTILRHFEGQCRTSAGFNPVQRFRLEWKSSLFTSQQHLDEFKESVNTRTYSMTSGQGGKPIKVSIMSAKLKPQTAMLVIVSTAPSLQVTSLTISRHGKGLYRARAERVENRRLSAPSGIGSFGACSFELAADENPSDVRMTLDDGSQPLPSSPVKEYFPSR